MGLEMFLPFFLSHFFSFHNDSMAEGNHISQSVECTLKHRVNTSQLGVYPL